MYSCLRFLIFSFLLYSVVAQSGNDNDNDDENSSASVSLSRSVSTATSVATVTTTTRSRGEDVEFTTTFTTTFPVTYTITPTSSEEQEPTASPAEESATPESIHLETKIDPAFGVLGGILILTGVPSAFWGHKNRWTSFFLAGFYTLSLVCFVLILNFGIIPAVHAPSQTLRGLFVLASVIAGAAGGLIAIFFWKASQYFIGAWGGFAFALWIQCFRNGGLIEPIGYRWIMYIGCALVGFVLCTIPRIHYHVLLISTSFVGASAVMLGVDCYTTAGLKEFYVWNIGFMSLFRKLRENNIQFRVSQTMQIELGLLAAVAIAGIAVQLRILVVLQRKLAEIKVEQKKRDEEAAMEHSHRFTALDAEREQWEKDHPSMLKDGRYESGLSTVPLMKDLDGSSSPTLSDPRGRAQSGLSEFQAASASKEDMDRFARDRALLPNLDLGTGIESNVPQNFISEDGSSNGKSEPGKGLGEKAALLSEIQTIRRSIEMLRSESSASGGTHSRRPSLSSKRTLSFDATTALSPPLAVPPHLRPPREPNFRDRTHSMELSSMANSATVGGSIGRPTSTPLTHADWDDYVQDRKLLQPPSGISAPIQPTAVAAAERSHLPQSVADAVNRRKARESLVMDNRGVSGDSSDDIPLAAALPSSRHRHHKQASSSDQAAPVTILPPRKIAAPTPQKPEANRVKTYEELEERHRQKMRGMQAPVTQEAREQADLAAAKERWERNTSLERNAMTRKQQEHAEALAKKRKGEKRRSSTLIDLAGEEPKPPHARSLSSDKLAALAGGSSKRVSTMKVQDWQKYQQDANESGYRQHRGTGADVPFPGKTRR